MKDAVHSLMGHGIGAANPMVLVSALHATLVLLTQSQQYTALGVANLSVRPGTPVVVATMLHNQ